MEKENPPVSPWNKSGDDIGNNKDLNFMKSIIKVGVWIFVLVFIAIGGVSIFRFFGNQSTPSVSLEFSDVKQVYLGQPFNMDVTFANNSDGVLKDARLSLALPNGVYFLGGQNDQRVFEQIIGDLGPGSLNKETFNLIVTDGEQSLKRLEAKLAYSSGVNTNTSFESKAEKDVSVGQPVVGLEVETPQSVFSGEDFEAKIKYRNNSPSDLKNLTLRVEYPPIFQFQNSSVKPDTGNNSWDLGTLAKQENGEITIDGNVIGQEGSFFNFKVIVESRISGQDYSLSTQTANVGVSAAPLSLSIVANGKSDYVSKIGDGLRYALTYKNNSNFSLQNIVIKARVAGELIDFTKAKTNAAFDSVTNTFTWTVANEPKLANLPPGDQGSVYLEMDLVSVFPIKRFSDKNYSMKIQGEISSPTVPAGTAAARTVSVANLETRVAGKMELTAKAFYRDAASGILNSGPFPPKVNQPTQYTIHWILKNYSTDMTNVKLSTFLQSGAKWTGNVKSNIMGILPTFNPANNQVVWQIDQVSATKGIIGDPAEAIFQIEVTPAVNQVGQAVNLISDTNMEATDSFVNLPVTDAANELTTRLQFDPTISGDTGVQL